MNKKSFIGYIIGCIIFLIILFLIMFIIFIPELMNKDYWFIIPIMIFTILIIFIVYLSIQMLINFNKQYIIYEEYILIINKDNIKKIKKENIKNLIIIKYKDDIYKICFEHENKKYKIYKEFPCYIKNKENINQFIDGLNFKTKKNRLLGFIEFVTYIAEIFN